MKVFCINVGDDYWFFAANTEDEALNAYYAHSGWSDERDMLRRGGDPIEEVDAITEEALDTIEFDCKITNKRRSLRDALNNTTNPGFITCVWY